MNSHKSNIKNNGEYFYMVNNIFFSFSDFGCIEVKVHNYFNNYWNYNFIFSELDDVAKLLN